MKKRREVRPRKIESGLTRILYRMYESKLTDMYCKTDSLSKFIQTELIFLQS